MRDARPLPLGRRDDIRPAHRLRDRGRGDLLAADESLIASAEPLPHSDGAAADGAPVEEELVETRLLAEDLDAGFHVLRFRGEPTPLDLLLAARPPGQVQRLAGATRIGTAVAVSQATFDTADTVVLARADEYADALSGAPLAAQFDAPILLTGRDGLAGATAGEIARLGADEAVLLGGEAALSPQVDADLAATDLATRRVSGPTRFATAAAVARELDGAPTTAFVTEGAHADPARGWPDALAAGPAIATAGETLLLTGPDRLPPGARRRGGGPARLPPPGDGAGRHRRRVGAGGRRAARPAGPLTGHRH